MTTQTQTEIQKFQAFVAQKVDNGQTDLSPEQVLAMWKERRESIKASQEALDDMEGGATGRPLDEVMDEIERDLDNAPHV